MTTTTSTPTSRNSVRRQVRVWLLWLAGFLAFPVAGLAGTLAGGPVDGLTAAALGGAATGAVLGLGQALASSRRLPLRRWVLATALGMGIGLPAGAHLVGYGTSLRELAVMGAATGILLGPAQALALPNGARHRWAWAVAMPALWAIGWSVTTSIGIAVTEQFTTFGASGAITVTALLGVLLHAVLPPTTAAVPSPSTAFTNAGELR